MSEKTKKELVVIPSPGRGHLQATLKMANLLVDRSDQRLSITVLVMDPFHHDPNSIPHSSPRPESNPSIRLVVLPRVPPISPSTDDSSFSLQNRFIDAHKDHVRNEVVGLVRGFGTGPTVLAGFVVDMFCTGMIDVANEFRVATYMFFASGASILGLMLYFQGMRDYLNGEYNINHDEIVQIPSYKIPVPTKLLPSVMFEKNALYLDHASRFREMKGILVNTFSGLECHAIESLSKGIMVPPVYPIGPILDYGGDDHDDDGVRKWLDKQPVSSVVFVCFGSKGYFDENQVKEIAVGLERSGHRFLWSLRKPPVARFETPGEYEDPGEVLPEGFLRRSVGVGRVIGWAPQLAVLSHPAVRGFVSHCGWNSVLESVWCGVPMAVWPIFAEQQMNAFQLVEELGVAVEIKMDYNKSLSGNVMVKSEEIERGIKRVMECESGVGIRANVEALKVKSRKAVVENGKSFECMRRFIESVMVEMLRSS